MTQSRVLLWSKTKQLGHQPEPAIWDLITLEGTLLGFMIDSLTWCGDEGSSELNYESCPGWEKDCKDNAVSVLWKSKKFAESACGVVTVMFNGSLSQAYDNSSILGRVEIHNLNPVNVTELKVWVKHDQDGTSSNSCSSTSLKQFNKTVSERNITFICRDIQSLGEILQENS